MKKNLFLFGSFLFLWCIALSSKAQLDCGTDMLHQYRMQNDAVYAAQYTATRAAVYNTLVQNTGSTSKLQAAPFVIPTVVHIIHIGEAVGTGSNLSDATVVAAIADLNTRMSNANGNGVNMNVQFCLAVRDSAGVATNGITRYNASAVPNFIANGVTVPGSSCTNGADPTPIYNATAWPQDRYYNIYIFYKACGATAWSGLAGGYTNFQYVSFTPTLNGPLLAHETGHYLGLNHVFAGDNGGTSCPVNNNCLVDGDGVCDTPPLISGECTTSTCTLPPGGVLTNSTYNYLSYCFANWDRYTQGQKDRVTATLAAYPLNQLLNSLGCTPLTPNDAGILSIGTPALNGTYTTLCNGANYSLAPVVKLRNFGTAPLTSVSIKYKLDANSPSTYSWSGSLAAGATVDVTLPSIAIPQGTHTFLSYTTSPNGAADGYGNNDSSDVTGIVVNGPAAITATTSQTNTTCAGNNGTATVNPSGGILQTYFSDFSDFESGINTWTLVNGAQPNQWCVGNAANAHYAGSYGIYLSNNNCPTWSFTAANYSTIHFYKDFTFPANASNIKVKFYWNNSSGPNCSGVDSSDYIAAYLVSTGFTPTAGTLVSSGQIGSKYCNGGYNIWHADSVTGLDANAGTSKRIVFTWRNEFCANTPPAMDNITISYTRTFAYTYLWSNAQTTQTATGLAPGTYTCTITDANGCTGTKSVTILNGCTGVTISAGGPTTFCQGGNVVLTSSLSSGNLWSNGATTQSITVTTSGSYSCTNNGSTSNTIVVTVNPIPATPTVTAGGPLTFCQGGSVTLTSSSASGNTWSPGGATTQSINVTSSGSYTVTVTTNGCTSSPSAAKVVTVNPIPSTPTVTAGGPLTFCQGGSVTLTSSSASGNIWSNGATTPSINVTSSGSYTVTVTTNGCTSSPSAAKVVTVNLIPSTPTITAGGPTAFCQGGSVTLTSSSAAGNIWSTGATTQSINATTSGTYTVTVTSNGCTSSPSAGTVVTVNPIPATPTITAGGPTTFCQGGSVTLTSSSATGNIWSTGATTQSINATTSGTYTVTVTSNGCTSSPSAGTVVTVNPIPATPTVTAGGPLTFCQGGSVTLTSSSASGNTWSPGGATTQSINVTSSGSYTVTVTTNGCTSSPSAAKVVTVNPIPATPTISASGPTTFCTGGSVTLTSSASAGNLWSTGATTQSINVSTSGTYVVTVTSNGCTSSPSAGTVVTVQSCSISISANGPTTFCQGGSVVLTSSLTTGNLWSTGATTQSITVSTSGTYNCTNGGNTSNSIVVTVKPLPTAATTPSGSAAFCQGSSVNVSANSGNAASFDGVNDFISISNPLTTATDFTIETWVYPLSGSTEQYILEFNNGNAAMVFGTNNINNNPIFNFITFSPYAEKQVTAPLSLPLNAWSHLAVTLSGTTMKLYVNGELKGTNGSVTTNPSALGVTATNILGKPAIIAGVPFNGYMDEVRMWNVARSQANIQANMNQTVPVNSTNLVGYYKLDEGSGTTTLESVSGSTAATLVNGTTWLAPSTLPWNSTGYLWSTGSTTQSLAISTVGTYTITVTAVNGCTASTTVAVTSNPVPSTPTVTAGGPLTFCQGGSVTLTSSSATGNIWSTGATTQSINVTTSGTYTVAVTSNGCTSSPSAGTVVTVNPIPATPTVTAGGPLTFCLGGSVTLTSSSATGNIWSNGATTQSINVTTSGSYTVVVTSNGCTASPSAAKVVTVNPIPATPTISASGPTTFCTGGSVTLTSSSASGNLWSTGATTQSINVTTSGNYTVAVTSNGCTSSPSVATTVTVQVCGSVTITAGGPTSFCGGGSVVLTSSLPTGNLWSTGATTQSITVTSSGSYNCTNGGSTSNTIVVTVNPAPLATVTPNGTIAICAGTKLTAIASGNAASFDGVDDYITIANPLSTATAFTFEAWVYWKGGNNWQRVFSFGNAIGVNMYFTPQGSSGFPMLDIVPAGAGQNVQSNITLGTNAWHHVAVTLSGTTAKFYIDGILTGTNSSYTFTPATLGATAHNSLGASEYPTDPYFNGYLDEVRFWNVARTLSQIQANMNKTISTGSSGLVAYYKLDESSGTSVLESVSGSTTAVANNGVAWLVPSTVPWNAASYLWSDGKTTQTDSITVAGTYTLTVTAANGCTATSAPVVITKIYPKPSATITASGPTTICTGQSVTLTAPGRGNAVLLDGTNDYITCATPIIPISGTYTVSFWAKETVAQAGFREIMSQGRNFYIGRDNTGNIRMGDTWLNTGATWPTDLQWHYYAVVRSNSNAYLYIDGNLAATKGSVLGNPIVVGGDPNLFIIGEQFIPGFGEAFGGQLDDITIWNTARSQAQIQTSMNTSVLTTSTGLVAYYKLDEGTGNTTINAVNNADAGTLTNGPTWVIPTSIPYSISSYAWSTAASTQAITVGSAATYKVTVANGYGCTATATKKVTISTPGASFTVTAGSLVLCGGSTVTFTANSGTGYTYQWIKDNVNISGATNKVYIANSAGVYKVQVTNTYGCTKISTSKTVTQCPRFGQQIVDNVPELNLSVYPNPTFDFITVSFDSEDASAELQILNVNGEVILKKSVEVTEETYEDLLDVSTLPQGIYLVQVRTNNNLSNVRFVKQ